MLEYLNKVVRMDSHLGSIQMSQYDHRCETLYLKIKIVLAGRYLS